MADGNRTEILTELTLEGVQQIQGDLRAIAERFKEGDKSREVAQKGFGDWIGTAHQLAGVLGVNLLSVYEKVKGIGAEFINYGKSAQSGDQAVAALIATAQGTGIENAITAAVDLGDRIDDIAIKAGVSGEALGAAFQTILERTGASAKGIASASNEVEKLAVVSAKLGKDVGGISLEYSGMTEGMLKTKGQLFQLLQSTGIFGKTTKGAAEAWAGLTDAKRAELLSYGLDKLSGQMAKMPPTFAEAEAGFENMMRIGREKIGEPLIRELTPALQDVAKEMIELGPDIDDIGKALAKEVGGGIREGGRLMKEALSWVKEHKGEIAKEIGDAAKTLKSVVEFVIANKEVLGAAFGAKTLAGSGVIGGAVKGAKGLGSAANAISGIDGGTVLGKNVGTTGSMVALSAAIIGVGLAAEQATLLLQELKTEEEHKKKGDRALGTMAGQGDVENVENVVRTMRDLDEAAGRSSYELNQYYAGMIAAAKTARAVKDINADVDRKKIDDARRTAMDLDAMGGTGSKGINDELTASAGMQVGVLLNAYNNAVKQGDQGMALLAAQALASGQMVGQAFLKTNADVQGGLDAMAELLAASGGQFAGFAASLKSKVAAPAAPKILMPGAKITVNQDFRNKDPDAVAIAFKRDIAKAAERRTSARYTGLFGL